MTELGAPGTPILTPQSVRCCLDSLTIALRMRHDVECEFQLVLDFDRSAGDRHRLNPEIRLLECECSLRTQQLVAKLKLRRYCQLLRYSMKSDLARYASLILSLTGSGSADAAALESDLRKL